MTEVSTISAHSDHLRPVAWPTWFAWVIVSALVPVLSTISETAFEKQISRDAQYPNLILDGLLALVLFATIAPPIMQWLVLRRVMPKLSFLLWIAGILISAVLWLVLMNSRHDHGMVELGFNTQHQLQRAAREWAGLLTAAHIVMLPWGPFLLWTAAISTLTSLVPAWTLGAASGQRRATLLFCAAAVVGACASAIVEQLYQMTFDNRPLNFWALNGLSWTVRFHVLAGRSGVGAVWGATTAIFLVFMNRPRPLPATGTRTAPLFAPYRAGGLAAVLLAPMAIAVMAPFAGYLAGPRGVVAGVPELRRALSFAPSQDASQGESVLAYSYDISVSLTPWPQVAMAPGGRAAIVRTIDQTLVEVDLTVGRATRELAGPLSPRERHDLAWSPDGRYLALRSDGAEVPIPTTIYTRHQSRVRLYAFPDLALVGEFSNSEGACFDSYAREPMLFSDDSKSLWLVCGHYYAPTGDDLMAIRLEVPTMHVLDVRRYGEGADGGEAQGLERLGGDVWAWQFHQSEKPFRIRDLTQDREVVAISVPIHLVGGMTAQTGNSLVDENTIHVDFCGRPPGATDTGPGAWICRTLTFDTPTGALIGSVDKSDHRIPNPPGDRPSATLSGHGLRIESFWRENSKAGELVVHDSASGRERQRLSSIAQRPIRMSADGVWLVTAPIDGRGLRVYRVYL